MQFHSAPDYLTPLRDTLHSLPLHYAPAIAFLLAIAFAFAVASATNRGGMR